MQQPEAEFFAALINAGMPEIPGQFSVVPYPQLIPSATLAEIDTFIRVFDRVTTRPAWCRAVTASAPGIARHPRTERCFFSAWDFHLSSREGWQLIEFNDNGSGFLYAGLINCLFYELFAREEPTSIELPTTMVALKSHLISIVEREAREFFGSPPEGLFLIVDDAASLERGKFRGELSLLRDLFGERGWAAAVAPPEEARWDGGRVLCRDRPVSFIVNRSTDFFWESEAWAPLRAAYEEGKVYVAPNPYTYATRSDKRLLELLSLSDWDRELGVSAAERAFLSAHVPPSYLLRADNLESIARRKDEFFFKPLHGFAGRGVLPSGQVGYSRLRRLIRKGQGYVAQEKVPKPLLRAKGLPDSTRLWTDLRVWAYGGERFLISGRASRQPELLDLEPPGGWLPTYAQR